ncbi:MAG: hypothetical protein Q9217_006626 [Psora testacea]
MRSGDRYDKLSFKEHLYDHNHARCDIEDRPEAPSMDACVEKRSNKRKRYYDDITQAVGLENNSDDAFTIEGSTPSTERSSKCMTETGQSKICSPSSSPFNINVLTEERDHTSNEPTEDIWVRLDSDGEEQSLFSQCLRSPSPSFLPTGAPIKLSRTRMATPVTLRLQDIHPPTIDDHRQTPISLDLEPTEAEQKQPPKPAPRTQLTLSNPPSRPCAKRLHSTHPSRIPIAGTQDVGL